MKDSKIKLSDLVSKEALEYRHLYRVELEKIIKQQGKDPQKFKSFNTRILELEIMGKW